MVKNNFLNRIEPIIIYTILYFPAFFPSDSSNNSDIYKNSSLLLFYSVISLFQIFFLIYLLKLKNTEAEKSGLKSFSFSAVSKSVIYAIFLIIIIILVNSFLNLFIKQTAFSIDKSAFFILKALIISLFTGYREEAFFRSYFISTSEVFYGKTVSVIISTLLFSLSHASGGIHAVLSAFFAGFFLSYIFLRNRNIHINALTHCIYNFIVLIF